MRSTSIVRAPVVAASAPRAAARGRASCSKRVPVSSPRIGSWLDATDEAPGADAEEHRQGALAALKLPSLAVRVALRGAPPRISIS